MTAPTHPSGTRERIEYGVECVKGSTSAYPDVEAARHHADVLNREGHKCGPHRVIKRTITEEDVTDAE